MEIWIGLDGDANPGEDISYAYPARSPGGDGGFLTVGAENSPGQSRGAERTSTATGILPDDDTELYGSPAPPAPSTRR